MPSVVDPIGSNPDAGAVTYRAIYTKTDGSPGEVQNPPQFTLSPPEAGEVRVFPSTEVGVFEVDFVHNGFAGEAVAMCGETDGDLGGGEKLIPAATDTITFRGSQVSAETVGFSAGPQHAPRA